MRLERAQTPEQIQELCRELIEQLRDPEYRSLRRAFSVWLGRVVLQRSGITEDIPEFQDLREVEERAAQWKQEYIRQGVVLGKAEGISIGEARGVLIGEARGEARGFRQALLDVLELRFGALPLPLTAAIASVSDAETLRALTMAAYHAESLQAFIALPG